MNSFSIRDIENLSGIRAHTLRIWEQRYGILRPKRKASRHRYYDNEDLKQILRISLLYHNGYKISKIASLKDDEIRQLALQDRDRNPHELYISQLIEASLEFDQERFEKVFHNIILYFGFEKSILQVVYPYLEKIGRLWMTGNIVPAQEHFASCMIRKNILLAIDGLEKVPNQPGRKVLLFSPPGEHHELPLLFMHYLLKKSGIARAYFGTSKSIEDVKDYLSHQPVTHLFCHLITNLSDTDLDSQAKLWCESFPDQQVVMAGPLVHQIGIKYPNLILLGTLEEVIRFGGSN